MIYSRTWRSGGGVPPVSTGLPGTRRARIDRDGVAGSEDNQPPQNPAIGVACSWDKPCAQGWSSSRRGGTERARGRVSVRGGGAGHARTGTRHTHPLVGVQRGGPVHRALHPLTGALGELPRHLADGVTGKHRQSQVNQFLKRTAPWDTTSAPDPAHQLLSITWCGVSPSLRKLPAHGAACSAARSMSLRVPTGCPFPFRMPERTAPSRHPR
jgi:hypothetical protein